MFEVSGEYQAIIPSEGSDTQEQRRQLVEKVKTGLSMDVNGKSVTFKLRESQGSHSDLFGVDVSAGAKRILFVELLVDTKTATASKMGKSYDEDAPDDYKRIGLVSLATSLLFQVLEHMGVEKVIGRIEIDNVSSINSRLKTKDVLRGGFYEVEVQQPVETVPSWRRSGKKIYTVITYLKSERRDHPLTLKDAAAK